MSTETVQPEEPDVPAAPNAEYDNPEDWADFGESEPEEGAQPPKEAQGAPAKEGEGEGEGEGEPNPYDEPPEFWSAERKALWNKDLPPELRQAIHEHEREASRAINGKLMEAAEKTKTAEGELQKFSQERDQLATWWQQMAPRLNAAYSSKWEGIDWQKMAAEDPALYVKMTAQRDSEARMLQEANDRHQTEIKAANERAIKAFEATKLSEHTKLAAKLPQYFGEGKAQGTYDKLGKYLSDLGIDHQRIQMIYEAPVIETALKAMLYDEAQAALKAKPTTQPATATQTSRRIAPGPGSRAGNPKGDAVRQAEQRLRTGQALSDDEVAELFG